MGGWSVIPEYSQAQADIYEPESICARCSLKRYVFCNFRRIGECVSIWIIRLTS